MEIATEFRIVYININSMELAIHISKILVSEKLAACCSVLPQGTSIFEWGGNIVERYEILIMIKTHQSKVFELSKRVQELHNDEVPEIITVAMMESSEQYLNWLHSTLMNNE